MKKNFIVGLMTAMLLAIPVNASEETTQEETEIATQENVKPIDLVQMGMTYDQIVETFGVEGKKVSETIVYSWEYKDGSGYLTITTQNGIVTAKNDIRTVQETCDITLEKYSSIKTGMTYAEVKDIIGSDGTLMSDTDLGGIKSTMYMWRSSDGIGTATIMFQNDAVVSGSQVGLK